MSLVSEYPKHVNRTLDSVLYKLIQDGFPAETLAEFLDENKLALELASCMGDAQEVHDLALDHLLGHGTLDMFMRFPELCEAAACGGVSLDRLAYHYSMGDLEDQEIAWRSGVPIEDLIA